MQLIIVPSLFCFLYLSFFLETFRCFVVLLVANLGRFLETFPVVFFGENAKSYKFGEFSILNKQDGEFDSLVSKELYEEFDLRLFFFSLIMGNLQ